MEMKSTSKHNPIPELGRMPEWTSGLPDTAFLTAIDLEGILGVCKTTVKTMVKDGRLPPPDMRVGDMSARGFNRTGPSTGGSQNKLMWRVGTLRAFCNKGETNGI